MNSVDERYRHETALPMGWRWCCVCRWHWMMTPMTLYSAVPVVISSLMTLGSRTPLVSWMLTVQLTEQRWVHSRLRRALRRHRLILLLNCRSVWTHSRDLLLSCQALTPADLPLRSLWSTKWTVMWTRFVCLWHWNSHTYSWIVNVT